MMHVQSCCFANQTYCFFLAFLASVVVVVAKALYFFFFWGGGGGALVLYDCTVDLTKPKSEKHQLSALKLARSTHTNITV